MAAPELRDWCSWAAAALVGAACACSQAPQPVHRSEAPAATEPAAAAAQPAEAPASAPSAAAATAPAGSEAPAAPEANATDTGSQPATAGSRPGVVVLDPGEETNRPKTLVEAARAERERRAHAGKPAVVINDKTLPHLATGQLTYAQPKKPGNPPGKAPGAPAGQETTVTGARDEAYWRGRAREIRTRWHDAVEEIGKLEQSAADLRRRFYSEDDPYRRDVQIKPEWDHALDQLAHAREEAKASRHELEDFLEEGRREGALPGWLREGSELEPASAAAPERPSQAIEPPEAEGSGAIEPPELGEGPP